VCVCVWCVCVVCGVCVWCGVCVCVVWCVVCMCVCGVRVCGVCVWFVCICVCGVCVWCVCVYCVVCVCVCVTECDLETPTMRRPGSTTAVEPWKNINKQITILVFLFLLEHVPLCTFRRSVAWTSSGQHHYNWFYIYIYFRFIVSQNS